MMVRVFWAGYLLFLGWLVHMLHHLIVNGSM
jgi:hypothetical protein